ncbi:MAG: glycosyltransferase [Pseudonocardiales bacterium]|nr:glycosyltransferase [Pseudonocardiales bacterium]
MKVLHVITGLGVGGAELQLRSLLQHTRHQSDVVTLYNPGPVAGMISGDGVRVRDLGMTRNTELSALPRLTRLIRAGGYDVVHTHLYRACIYGRLAARLAGTPVVVTTEHSIGATHLERRRMTFGVRALYLGTDLCSDATIAVSDTVAQRLTTWGVAARKIETIPNGLDFARVAYDAAARDRIRGEFALPPDAYVIGVLGRLDPIKRFDLVIRAAAPLLNDQHRLLIVGDGQIRPDLETQAQRQGVAELVTFAGERHDVAAMLSSLDLFVASSEQETFGLSVLEALANGIPALYTTCPALEGIETERARQVPGEVEGLRREIAAELAGGPRPREDVPTIREQYGIEAVTRRIDNLYDRLIARRRPVRRGPADASHVVNPVGGDRCTR